MLEEEGSNPSRAGMQAVAATAAAASGTVAAGGGWEGVGWGLSLVVPPNLKAPSGCTHGTSFRDRAMKLANLREVIAECCAPPRAGANLSSKCPWRGVSVLSKDLRHRDSVHQADRTACPRVRESKSGTQQG